MWLGTGKMCQHSYCHLGRLAMTDDALNQILNLSTEDVRLIASQVLGTDAIPVGLLTAREIGQSVGQATVGIYHVTS
jgi:hypothetical protein